jgi:hypothetical protein
MAKATEPGTLDFNEETIILDFLYPTVYFLTFMQIGKAQRRDFIPLEIS